jgi:aspartate aminotransferase
LIPILKSPAQLEAAITPKNKMMWFSTPCNPSGSVYSREELTALAAVLKNTLTYMLLLMKSTRHINFSGTFALDRSQECSKNK